MIRRTYYIRIAVYKDGINVRTCWRVRGTYSLFAQQVALVNEILRELTEKYPNHDFDLEEFKKV